MNRVAAASLFVTTLCLGAHAASPDLGKRIEEANNDHESFAYSMKAKCGFWVPVSFDEGLLEVAHRTNSGGYTYCSSAMRGALEHLCNDDVYYKELIREKIKNIKCTLAKNQTDIGIALTDGEFSLNIGEKANGNMPKNEAIKYLQKSIMVKDDEGATVTVGGYIERKKKLRDANQDNEGSAYSMKAACGFWTPITFDYQLIEAAKKTNSGGYTYCFSARTAMERLCRVHAENKKWLSDNVKQIACSLSEKPADIRLSMKAGTLGVALGEKISTNGPTNEIFKFVEKEMARP